MECSSTTLPVLVAIEERGVDLVVLKQGIDTNHTPAGGRRSNRVQNQRQWLPGLALSYGRVL